VVDIVASGMMRIQERTERIEISWDSSTIIGGGVMMGEGRS
jgi:hypothetical protein